MSPRLAWTFEDIVRMLGSAEILLNVRSISSMNSCNDTDPFLSHSHSLNITAASAVVISPSSPWTQAVNSSRVTSPYWSASNMLKRCFILASNDEFRFIRSRFANCRNVSPGLPFRAGNVVNSLLDLSVPRCTGGRLMPGRQ
jgi:hypothetical protein